MGPGSESNIGVKTSALHDPWDQISRPWVLAVVVPKPKEKTINPVGIFVNDLKGLSHHRVTLPCWNFKKNIVQLRGLVAEMKRAVSREISRVSVKNACPNMQPLCWCQDKSLSYKLSLCFIFCFSWDSIHLMKYNSRMSVRKVNEHAFFHELNKHNFEVFCASDFPTEIKLWE